MKQKMEQDVLELGHAGFPVFVTQRPIGNFRFLGSNALRSEQDLSALATLHTVAGLERRTVLIPTLEENPRDKAKVLVVDGRDEAKDFRNDAVDFCLEIPSTFYKVDCPADALILLNPKEQGLLFSAADCPVISILLEDGESRKALIGIHAGWQGLLQGIIPRTLKELQELGLLHPRIRAKIVVSPYLRSCCSEYENDIFPSFFAKWPFDRFRHYYIDRGDNGVVIIFKHIITDELARFGVIPNFSPFCSCCSRQNGLDELRFFSHRAESGSIGEKNVGRFAVLALG